MYVFCVDTELERISLSALLLRVAVCPYSNLHSVCRRELCSIPAGAFETSPVLGFMLFLLLANGVGNQVRKILVLPSAQTFLLSGNTPWTVMWARNKHLLCWVIVYLDVFPQLRYPPHTQWHQRLVWRKLVLARAMEVGVDKGDGEEVSRWKEQNLKSGGLGGESGPTWLLVPDVGNWSDDGNIHDRPIRGAGLGGHIWC